MGLHTNTDSNYLIFLTSSPSPLDRISNLKPFLLSFSRRFVFAKHAAGANTPPRVGNFSFCFRIVVADNNRDTQVAP